MQCNGYDFFMIWEELDARPGGLVLFDRTGPGKCREHPWTGLESPSFLSLIGLVGLALGRLKSIRDIFIRHSSLTFYEAGLSPTTTTTLLVLVLVLLSILENPSLYMSYNLTLWFFGVFFPMLVNERG
jgi:hypothetical protein